MALVETKEVVLCCNCANLRVCRVVLKCGHPNGLKRPGYSSFCSYGIPKEENIKNN